MTGTTAEYLAALNEIGQTIKVKYEYHDYAACAEAYLAYDDNTYEPGCPIGTGPSKLTAKLSLLEQIYEQQAAKEARQCRSL